MTGAAEAREGAGGTLRVGVVGVGHFGRYHAEKMAALEGARLVAVADSDSPRAAEVAARLDTDALPDHRALIGRIDAASVAVPAAAHYEVVKDFLDAGIHVLVEKPFTERAATARELAALAETRGLVLQVGLIERFSEAFRTVAPRITRPVYVEAARISPFSPRGTDVSVVLDMMIHDIDIILALVDAPVADIDAVGAPVFSASEDIANARLKFANGCVANVTASRVSPKTERTLRIFQPDVYLKVDHGERSVRVARRKEGAEALTGPDDVALEHLRFEKGDPLQREIESFAHAVQTRGVPAVTGADGVRSLEVAHRITASIAENRARLDLD
ncbi:MAG: Gfo/Idh/MocA family oxidoreductase [Rhodospirillales bacterium]|nr:Gfo/Idh/MocA family oxidoreductase [Rhodospirillales bacterium]MDE0379730.1 Gfo/Idh/MocA family oxidoreductase [Rhodospirillales bacterium]